MGLRLICGLGRSRGTMGGQQGMWTCSSVAEQVTFNHYVVGSTPTRSSKLRHEYLGSVAQLGRAGES